MRKVAKLLICSRYFCFETRCEISLKYWQLRPRKLLMLNATPDLYHVRLEQLRPRFRDFFRALGEKRISMWRFERSPIAIGSIWLYIRAKRAGKVSLWTHFEDI